ncbi:MAG: DUF962 domain-containing protein [Woeseiaceae bacterium]|nr:DUF962 domain-containing protein [Woeseiaceae bacterium]
MNTNSKLMDMLTGYAAAHQHPVNIAVHLIGIPVIMLGVFIILSSVNVDIDGFSFNLAQLAVVAMFIFYMTLDRIFALVFLLAAWPIAMLAAWIAGHPNAPSVTIAAIAFFGGYLAQFVGHAVEKSAPVILKHPVQANLAAPFFTIVEIFKLLGLRDTLFNEVQARIAELREEQKRTA